MNAFPSSRLDALPPLREVIAEYRVNAQRSLGQHFLLDLNLTRRIANAATHLKEGTVIEVGPGPGGLTRSLLSAGASNLVAIERDERCIRALMPLQEASANRLTVLEVTRPSLVETMCSSDAVVLPYQIPFAKRAASLDPAVSLSDSLTSTVSPNATTSAEYGTPCRVMKAVLPSALA